MPTTTPVVERMHPGAAAPVTVLDLDDLSRTVRFPRGSRVVVDATAPGEVSLPSLAAIVRWRRRLRAGGGNLVVAADGAVAAALTRTGLHWVLPHRPTVDDAVAAVSADV